MAPPSKETERAFRRVAILKRLVLAARENATASPTKPRNVELGLTDADLPTAEARRQIADTFGELIILLDHLHVAHVAATFELEAKKRISTAVGVARNAIRTARKDQTLWPLGLIRDQGSFDGLQSIAELLDVTDLEAETFKKVRITRNKFSHGDRLEQVPDVSAEETIALLIDCLERLK